MIVGMTGSGKTGLVTVLVEEALRAGIPTLVTDAAVSLVLRLLGRDPDPAKSKEQVLLSVLAERRLAAGQNADVPG